MSKKEKALYYHKVTIEVPFYIDDFCDFCDKDYDDITEDDHKQFVQDSLERMKDTSNWIMELRGFGKVHNVLRQETAPLVGAEECRFSFL